MSLFKQIRLTLSRRYVRTLLLLLVFFLTFIGNLSCQLLMTSAEATKDRIIQQIGTTVTLDYASDEDISPLFTPEIRSQLLSVPHVIGCNQHYSDYATPVNFKNCRFFSGIDPSQQENKIEDNAEAENYVVIDGNTDVSLIEMFRTGTATLLEGHFPDEGTSEALISRQLASQENLQLKDNLCCLVNGTTYTFTVCGIYDTTAGFEITEDNIVGTAVFSFSPYNRIYTDFSVTCQIFGISPESRYIDIYIDQPDNLQTTGQAIKNLPLDWSAYRLINTTQTEYNTEASSTEATLSATRLLMQFFSVFSILILIFITCFWAESTWYESGIFMALGTSKWYALLQYVLTMLCIALPAYFISAILCTPVASFLLQSITKLQAVAVDSVYDQFLTGTELDVSIQLMPLPLSSLLKFLLQVLLTVCFSCMIPAYSILKMKPLQILASKKE